MQHKNFERLKELAFQLSILSAEMAGFFAEEERLAQVDAEEVKKIPTARSFTCRG